MISPPWQPEADRLNQEAKSPGRIDPDRGLAIAGDCRLTLSQLPLTTIPSSYLSGGAGIGAAVTAAW
jgi:hypothetical protein